MQINFVDLLIQNTIDAHSDLIANSFQKATNVTQNAIEYHSDLTES
jgi:hypothetical protein